MIERYRILNKIRALLAKTVENGCTEAEAMAALDRARALMDAYEVTEGDLHEAARAEAHISEPTETRDENDIRRRLYMAIGNFCDCRAWREVERIRFCGLRVDVEFAEYLTGVLDAFVRAELARHMIGCLYVRNYRRKIITGFVVGCTDRIAERLYALAAQSRRRASKNSRALVVIKAELIEKALAGAGIELADVAQGEPRMDPLAYLDGRAAGERASFGRPVDGPAGTLRIGPPK